MPLPPRSKILPKGCARPDGSPSCRCRGSASTGSAKRAIAATVSSSDTGDPTVAPEQRVERGQRVADGTEVAAGYQDHRQAQRHHDVEHGALAVERHHDAAD